MLEIEVMLDPQDIEAIAAAIAPRVAAELQAQSFPRRGFVRAEQVAAFLKVDVSWVYEHKHLLGAIRIGDGRGALRFEAARVLSYLRERRVGPERAAPRVAAGPIAASSTRIPGGGGSPRPSSSCRGR